MWDGVQFAPAGRLQLQLSGRVVISDSDFLFCRLPEVPIDENGEPVEAEAPNDVSVPHACMPCTYAARDVPWAKS